MLSQNRLCVQSGVHSVICMWFVYCDSTELIASRVNFKRETVRSLTQCSPVVGCSLTPSLSLTLSLWLSLSDSLSPTHYNSLSLALSPPPRLYRQLPTSSFPRILSSSLPLSCFLFRVSFIFHDEEDEEGMWFSYPQDSRFHAETAKIGMIFFFKSPLRFFF